MPHAPAPQCPYPNLRGAGCLAAEKAVQVLKKLSGSVWQVSKPCAEKVMAKALPFCSLGHKFRGAPPSLALFRVASPSRASGAPEVCSLGGLQPPRPSNKPSISAVRWQPNSQRGSAFTRLPSSVHSAPAELLASAPHASGTLTPTHLLHIHRRNKHTRHGRLPPVQQSSRGSPCSGVSGGGANG